MIKQNPKAIEIRDVQKNLLRDIIRKRSNTQARTVEEQGRKMIGKVFVLGGETNRMKKS